MTFYNLNKDQNKKEVIENFKKLILKNLDLVAAKSIEKFEIANAMIKRFEAATKTNIHDYIELIE